MNTNRRQFLGLALSSAGLPFAQFAEANAQTVKSSAKIVIIGAGAAGTALANRLIKRLDGVSITIIDPRKDHLYQPRLSLVAAGLKPADYVISKTTDWLQSGVNLVQETANAIDPEVKTVTTSGGQNLDYDYLVLAPGLVLDHDAIEGFSLDMVGENGIGSLYAGLEYAAKTWVAASKFADEGGMGLFTRPATEMKCAGAPLKHTFLIDDIARRRGNRGKAEIAYFAPQGSLFGVPIVAEKVRMLFGDRDIQTGMRQTLKALDPSRKRATFSGDEGETEIDYDYIHVIPPQRAPAVIREAGLSWSDKWIDQGWAEVDRETLRHRRYNTIFAVGDVAGVPKGKTSASVKWQVPVVEDHLVAAIDGKEGTALYNGYTSCPMITQIGRAMLVEFDYNNDLVPSFPGIIAPLEELWISWLMKELALKPIYNAMLRGEA